jgi:hypothetical protein
MRRPVIVVLTTMRPSGSHRGGVGGVLLECVEFGLQGLDDRGQLGDEGREIGCHQFGH